MNHIRSGLIQNSKLHPNLGAAMVGGISLSPVSQNGVNWCQSIGGNPVALTSDEATSELLSIVEAARKTYADENADLKDTIASTAESIKDAEKLARLPVVGDETETIQGMVFAAEHRAASQEPSNTETRNANFLAQHVESVFGLDVSRIKEALAGYQAEISLRGDLVADLRKSAATLRAIAEKASAPITREQVARFKADAKRLREVPAAIADLRQLRIDITAIADRLNSTIKQMESVA